MPYVPRGYLTLLEAVARIALVRAPDTAKDWQAVRAEYSRLRDHCAWAFRPLPVKTVNDRIWGSESTSPVDVRDRWTAADQARLEEVERLHTAIGTVYARAANDLRVALAEGDLSASYIDHRGDIRPVATGPWRLDAAEGALRRGKLPGVAYREDDPEADGLLALSAFEIWLGPASPEPAEPAEQSAQSHINSGVATYSTGVSGRPSSRHLLEAEMRRRFSERESCGSYGAECQALATWLAAAHPEAAQATPKTIKNSCRGVWKALQKDQAVAEG